MAKRKKAQPWDAVFNRVLSINFPQVIYPPKPTTADLDAAEEELNFKFPASYRAFAEKFGLGGVLEMLDVLLLVPPPDAIESHWSRSVLEATHRVQTEFPTIRWPSNNPAPAAFLMRAVVFALDGVYDTFVFDPREVTDARLRECRIYDIRREGDIVAIATSFDGWLRWVDQHHRHLDEEDEEPEFLPIYKPNSVEPNPMWYVRDSAGREKERPAKVDAKLWLAFNNNTARDLALSIRDAGHTEAFPILADALQEAGCTNADLLDACRTGDPDIDGKWVLQVLLGKG